LLPRSSESPAVKLKLIGPVVFGIEGSVIVYVAPGNISPPSFVMVKWAVKSLLQITLMLISGSVATTAVPVGVGVVVEVLTTAPVGVFVGVLVKVAVFATAPVGVLVGVAVFAAPPLVVGVNVGVGVSAIAAAAAD